MVRQLGRSRKTRRPWLSRKRSSAPAGNSLEVTRVSRPDGGAQRDEVLAPEALREPFGPEELPRGELWRERSCVERGAPSPAEVQDLSEQRPERRPKGVATLGEDATEAGSGVLEAALGHRHREAHVRGLAGHAPAVQQAAEDRVVPLVVDDEAGVDGDRTPLELDLHRVGVPTEAICCLEEGQLVPVGEQRRRGDARDARSDHCDPHRPSCSCISGQEALSWRDMRWAITKVATAKAPLMTASTTWTTRKPRPWPWSTTMLRTSTAQTQIDQRADARSVQTAVRLTAPSLRRRHDRSAVPQQRR